MADNIYRKCANTHTHIVEVESENGLEYKGK